MKRFFTLTAVATLTMSTMVFATSPINPDYINEVGAETTVGEHVEAVNPIITIDRDTFEEIVPAKEMANSLGYDLKWDNETKTLKFINGEKIFTATMGSNIYTVNGYNFTMETPAEMKQDTAYVPASLSKVMEAFDINSDISEIILTTLANKESALLEEQLISNEEYKAAYLSTGGDEADYVAPQYEISTKFISQNSQYITFEVYRFTALASSFTDETYYTFDLNDGTIMSLENFLGEDYAETVKEEVVEQAKEREETDPETYNYFEEELENLVVDENTQFYLDDMANIVVVFPKYSIAAGVYGAQEFTIPVVKIMH